MGQRNRRRRKGVEPSGGNALRHHVRVRKTFVDGNDRRKTGGHQTSKLIERIAVAVPQHGDRPAGIADLVEARETFEMHQPPPHGFAAG